MKKSSIITSLVVGLFFISSGAYGQGLYFGAQLGYAGGLASMTSLDNTTVTADKTSYEAVKMSLGKGANIGAIIGTNLNDNVGLELGINYLLGGKTTITQDDQVNNAKTERVYQAKMLRVVPTVVIKAEQNDITPYAKLGVVIGSGSFTDNSTSESEFAGQKNTVVMNEKYSGGIALGITGSLGVLFEMSKTMAFFAELQNMTMSYAPTKSVIDEASLNGTNNLDNMTTSEKEWEYSKTVDEDNTAPIDPAKPTSSTIMSFPFGSLGVNVGIVINL